MMQKMKEQSVIDRKLCDEKLPKRKNKGSFDRLIILDRRIDLVTPFLTQLTYEGLIDETCGGIKYG